MLKKLLVLLLFLPVMVGANDLSVVYTDVITADDTLSMRTDTVFSGIYDVREYKRIWLSAQLQRSPFDSNFVDDTFFVFLQHSPDRKNWSVSPISQTILKGANDTIMSLATSINRDSLFTGNWIRSMWIHVDSLDATDGGPIIDNEYKTRLTLWLNTVE